MTDPSPAVHRLFGTDSRVIALGFARMADALGNSFLIITLPLYIASEHITGGRFGLTPSLIAGVVLGLFGLVNSFVQPFAGRFSDRTGRRRLFIITGLLLLATANGAFSFVTSYLGMMGVRALQGLGAALTITASMALINELSVTGERGNNMGVYNAFRLVGFGLGPLAAGVVIQAGPYPFPLLGALSGIYPNLLGTHQPAILSRCGFRIVMNRKARRGRRKGRREGLSLHALRLLCDLCGLKIGSTDSFCALMARSPSGLFSIRPL